MFNFNQRRVLVAGGTGLIGRPLVDRLIEAGAKVSIASLDDSRRAHPDAEFKQLDLTSIENCMTCCKGQDYVFNLLCVKGSPAVTTNRPASFFVPNITFNTNLMEAARRSNVEGYLFSSSLAVYCPAEIFYEDDVWKTFPSENDKFAGWAKRMGELQAEAYRIEYGWNKISIVRPANVFGPNDNFDLANAMVVPSLIRRAVGGESPLTVWGDGSAIRDFIYADDVAKGMLLVAQSGEQQPVNLGSGTGVSIRELVDVIVDNIDPKPEVIWDTSKPTGDKKRVLDVSRARSLGFKPSVTLKQGIHDTLKWYRDNRAKPSLRYDIFAAKGAL